MDDGLPASWEASEPTRLRGSHGTHARFGPPSLVLETPRCILSNPIRLRWILIRGRPGGLTTAKRDERYRLRCEVKDLGMGAGVHQEAAAFFAKENQ